MEKNIKTFKEHLDERHGKTGTKTRDEFEMKAKAFMIGELIKEQRRVAKLTQQELAEKTGTRKSYISRIENGKSDIQLSTLYKLIEQGLGRQLRISIS
jgi:DNA-binding XRE family transcriptional regulator